MDVMISSSDSLPTNIANQQWRRRRQLVVEAFSVFRQSAEELVDVSLGDRQLYGYDRFRCPRASAYAAAMLAEPFGVDCEEVVSAAIVAGLFLDLFSHVVDDATDAPAVDGEVSGMHLASFALAEAIARLTKICPDSDFKMRMRRYMIEASKAERFFLAHRRFYGPFTEMDFKMMGRKSSLIKTNAALFASLGGRSEELKIAEIGLEAASIGIQLIDDLMDWKEDFSVGTRTYPISIALELLAGSLDGIADVVESCAVVRNVVGLSIRYLRSAAKTFESIQANMLVGLLRDLEENLESILGLVEGPLPSVPSSVFPMLRTFLSPEMSH